MATFYLDFVNGNDASAGTSWATAWKTLNNGATAARIAPGDEIRIAKTADPTSIGNATWTSKSATVTLATAQTANIYLDGAWTAANTATTTTTTTRKEGTNAAQITTPATTNTSTLYAYLTVGGASGLDLSSYDAITFWFRNNSTAIADANRYTLRLCSDTLGVTAVDTFAIPAIASTANWVPLTLTRNGGGNLGNAIKSIALYTGTSSPGNSQQIWIDNILACTNSGLNLTSLISKNSAGYTDVMTGDTWHGLQSINGTTVNLANHNSRLADESFRGYWTSGTSPATVTTYIRPTYKMEMQSSNAAAQPIQDSGTAGNLITFSGGWNTSNTTQDGDTWIDGQNGLGWGISINTRTYIKIQRLNACRFNTGYTFTTTPTGCVIDNCIFINSSVGLQTGIPYGSLTFTSNNNNNGSTVNTDNTFSTFNARFFNNLATASITRNTYASKIIYNNCAGELGLNLERIDYLEFIDNAQNLTSNYMTNINDAVIKNNTGTGTLYASNGVLVINKLTASGNTNLGIFNGQLIVKQTNATSSQLLGSTNAASSFSRRSNYPLLTYNGINNDINDNRSYWYLGNALSQTTIRHTASGIAWQINITDTTQTITYPIYFPIAKVACNANTLVTVKAWVKLSHATDIGAKLMVQAYEIAGVTADVTATKSADTNWEELTITFTPTVAGVAQIYVQGYWLANLADESIFVDDVTVTQA